VNARGAAANSEDLNLIDRRGLLHPVNTSRPLSRPPASRPPIVVKQGGLKFMQSPDHEFRVFKAKARREADHVTSARFPQRKVLGETLTGIGEDAGHPLGRRCRLSC
jgi:hypothetical protein